MRADLEYGGKWEENGIVTFNTSVGDGKGRRTRTNIQQARSRRQTGTIHSCPPAASRVRDPKPISSLLLSVSRWPARMRPRTLDEYVGHAAEGPQSALVVLAGASTSLARTGPPVFGDMSGKCRDRRPELGIFNDDDTAPLRR